METNNNVILAEFLGRRGVVNKSLFMFKNLQKEDGNIWFTETELEFSKNKEWIREVFNKIESLRLSFVYRNRNEKSKINDYIFHVIRGSNSITIREINKNLFTKTIFGENSDLEICVNFVEWLNTKNKELGYVMFK